LNHVRFLVKKTYILIRSRNMNFHDSIVSLFISASRQDLIRFRFTKYVWLVIIMCSDFSLGGTSVSLPRDTRFPNRMITEQTSRILCNYFHREEKRDANRIGLFRTLKHFLANTSSIKKMLTLSSRIFNFCTERYTY